MFLLQFSYMYKRLEQLFFGIEIEKRVQATQVWLKVYNFFKMFCRQLITYHLLSITYIYVK